MKMLKNRLTITVLLLALGTNLFACASSPQLRSPNREQRTLAASLSTIPQDQYHRTLKGPRGGSGSSSSSSSNGGSGGGSGSGGSGSGGSGEDEISSAEDGSWGNSTDTGETESFVAASAISGVNGRSANDIMTNLFDNDRPAASIIVAAVGGLLCIVFLLSAMAILSFKILTSCRSDVEDDIYTTNNKTEQLMKESLEK